MRLALLALILGGIVWVTLDNEVVRQTNRQVRQSILTHCPPARPSTVCHILIVALDDR